MAEDILDFNTSLAISDQDIFKTATILDEGIHESFQHLSSNLKLPDSGTESNIAVIDEGIQEAFQSLTDIPVPHTEILQNAEILEQGIPEPLQHPVNTSLTHAEIIKNATIIDEGIKLCPLCRNEVRLFFINFNEKVLMCENFECDYPFGHEELIYVKENSNIQSDEEVASVISKPTNGSPTATCSVISTAAWSEIDKINKINDFEGQNDPRLEPREYYKHKKSGTKERKVKKLEDNKKILKEVEAIKKMHIELKKVDERCIKNEKWLKNLMSKQQSSGMALLKPEEISLFKQKKPEFGLGELKIDINPGSQENMSLIKIEIANTADGRR